MQTDVTLLANNSQHCWMLHVVCLQTLLHVVAQSLKPVKLFSHQLPSATVLDPFPQLFQHCWGHACSLCMVYKKWGWILFTMHCMSQIVGSSYIRLHTTANTQATMFRVVVSVCMQPDTSDDLIE